MSDISTTYEVHSSKSKGNGIVRYGDWLVVEFSSLQKCLSWAVCGGGMTTAGKVAWRRVREIELNQCTNPQDFLAEKLHQENITEAVGLLTSANLDAYADVEKTFGPYAVRCIATVGMGNALCVGDLPTAPNHIGTINLLCQLSVPLSDGAFIEAVSIATEARTKAVLESNIQSRRSAQFATGTGTDCIVIAAVQGDGESKYAGKHTIVGHLIGSSVFEAVRQGIASWKQNKKTK
jgi:adenosylcobinamide amidohydrolase